MTESVPLSLAPLCNSSPTGHRGQYDVYFVLGVPGRETFREKLDLTEALEWGDSLLMTGRAVHHGRKRTAISEQTVQRFRLMPNTDFGRNRTLVSADAEHPFRGSTIIGTENRSKVGRAG